MSKADDMRAKAARLAGGGAAGQQQPARPAPGVYPPPPYGKQATPAAEAVTPEPAPAPSTAPTPSSERRVPDKSVRPARGKVKLVRMTLDLVPALHADFEDWTTRTSRRLGQGRISKADVLRALVRELLHDKELQQRITEALRSDSRS